MQSQKINDNNNLINIPDYAPCDEEDQNHAHKHKKSTLKFTKLQDAGDISLCSHEIETPNSEYILKTDKDIADEAKKKKNEQLAIQKMEKDKMKKFFDR